ncbi:MAG: CocE/NonD family hydrolase [Myxococcales bacterium]|nr:CocE/NonD family hydrolase [Myxococcales bacterium]
MALRGPGVAVLCLLSAGACSSKNGGDAPSLVPNDGPDAPQAAGSLPDDNADAPGSSATPGSGDGAATDGPTDGASGSGGATDAMDTPDGAPDMGDPAFADCLEPARETPSGPRTPYPGGTWSVPDATHGITVEANVQIEMSDGVVLVGDVGYPTDLATGARAPGPFPVILTQNPYGPVFGAQYGELFVTHGYIYASVDVRGTSRSGGGVHDLFSPREADDGAELVEWAAQLDGSDGQVGLQGCSQLGINQLETATRLGPDSPVKAMIPACASGDFYRDTVFDNGVPSITANFLVPDSAMGDDTAYYRDYWQERDRAARAPAIAQADIPTLLWSGWHEPGALGSLDLYTVLQNVAAGRPANAPIEAGQEVSGKYQVILGDWGHGSGLDLGIELQWFDTWIKGIETGLATDTRTPLHFAELGGTERWINARCYPLVESYTPLHLSAGGRLSSSADDDEAHDVLEWVPQELPENSIEYASEPFAEGAMLAGPLSARLQVSSSNTNAQLFLQVFDRAPDGTLAQIAFGSVIGTLRETDPDKSWADDQGLPTRPFLKLEGEQPMTPGERTQLDVPLGPTVWSIEPGHAIVVRISTHPPGDSCLGVIAPPVGCYPTAPMRETLPGGIYDLHLGGEDGSVLSLPLLEHRSWPAVETAVSPTGGGSFPLPIDW